MLNKKYLFLTDEEEELFRELGRKVEEEERLEEIKRAESIGIEKGETSGIEKEKREIARKMLEEKISIDIVSKTTGLTKKEIKKLSKEA